MTKWNLKNASEKEKEIYRQEFEKVYQKELQRRTPVVPASKSVSVDTPKTTAQKQSRAAVKSGGPVLMPMAQKERQREAQQRTAQQFQQFGMDPTAIVGQQIGQWAGDVLHRKAAETGIDPGKSKAAYIAEKALGGAATSVEGTYNNILDNARAQVNAQLTNGYVTDTGVNLRDMQNFWAAVFGGKHAQYAQDTQAADKAVAEQLPAAADRMRSTKAAEYAQGLDEKYGATGLWKVGGDVASGVGGMLPNIVREQGRWGHGGERAGGGFEKPARHGEPDVLRRRKRGGPGAGLWRGRGHGAGVRPAFGRDGGRDREKSWAVFPVLAAAGWTKSSSALRAAARDGGP